MCDEQQNIKVDCTDIIEQVIAKTSEKQNNDFQKLLECMQAQRENMSAMLQAVQWISPNNYVYNKS